jgi:hypothetical protein
MTENQNFDDSLDQEIPEYINEDNIESALKPRDYSSRRVLIWEGDENRRNYAVEVISGLLTGAFVEGVATEAEALKKLDEELWDTFVVDFYNEGCSESEFVKKVNNYPDSILVALNLAPFTLPEERNRYKVEPLRKLFEIEKPKTEEESFDLGESEEDILKE